MNFLMDLKSTVPADFLVDSIARNDTPSLVSRTSPINHSKRKQVRSPTSSGIFPSNAHGQSILYTLSMKNTKHWRATMYLKRLDPVLSATMTTCAVPMPKVMMQGPRLVSVVTAMLRNDRQLVVLPVLPQ